MPSIPDPTDLPGLFETANFMAQQTDRWMFVAMLIIFLICGAWMTRYFTSQIQQARQEFTALSKDFTEHLITTNRELAVLLAGATKALADNTRALEHVKEKL